MKKIKVNIGDLAEYQDEYWVYYASQTICGKRARFLINLMGKYKVIHGDQVLYKGANVFDAIETWDSIEIHGKKGESDGDTRNSSEA